MLPVEQAGMGRPNIDGHDASKSSDNFQLPDQVLRKTRSQYTATLEREYERSYSEVSQSLAGRVETST